MKKYIFLTEYKTSCWYIFVWQHLVFKNFNCFHRAKRASSFQYKTYRKVKLGKWETYTKCETHALVSPQTHARGKNKNGIRQRNRGRRQGEKSDLGKKKSEYEDQKSYPEWPHRQCVGVAFRWSRVRVPVAAASLVICGPHLHRALRGAQWVLPWVVWGVTASQLDPPSLTSLSVAGCVTSTGSSP